MLQSLQAQRPATKTAADLEPNFQQSRFVDLKDFFHGLAKPKLSHFNGDRDKYQDWRAQFDIFVHQASVPCHYKMMLKNSLSGKPLQLVENLGYTDNQYQMAVAKLDQRYGGERRILQRHLESIVSMAAVVEDDLLGLENLSNRLCDIVTKLAEAGQHQELTFASTLYLVAQQKVPRSLLVQYHDTMKSDDSLVSFVDWLTRQVNIRCECAEIKSALRKNKEPARRVHNTLADTAQTQESDIVRCPLCEGSHITEKCKSWADKSIEERWKLARSIRLCYRCLSQFHLGNKCPKSRICGIGDCKRNHHPSLHYLAPTQPSSGALTSSSTSAFGVADDGTVLPKRVALRFIPVFVIGPDDKKVKVNAFLDDGSDSTYIREEVASSLGLPRKEKKLSLSTLVSDTRVKSSLVSFTLESLGGNIRRTIGARTLQKMCQGLEVPDWRCRRKGWAHLKGITFPRLPGHNSVDLLIGADHPELMLALEERLGKPGDPVARRTPLGWTCIGPTEALTFADISESNQLKSFHVQTVEARLDDQLRLMWSSDTQGVISSEPFNSDEKLAVQIGKSSLTNLGDRYEVGIPWKEGKEPITDCSFRNAIPENFRMATQRLLSLESSLLRDPNRAKHYQQQMNANIEKGYIRKISSIDQDGWYLPHFPVIREDRSTSKLRIVFDSAAKSEGISLNDMMLSGPKLQQDLLDILLRFRQKEIAISGDIKEMFPQVVLVPEDRKYHRILWRGLDLRQPIGVYEAQRLTFGDKASPYLAQFVMREHAKKHRLSHPKAADICLFNVYMDDILFSVDRVEEAIDLRQQLVTLLSTAGFCVRKWCSNELRVLEGVPPQDREAGVRLEEAELPSIKTLGVQWDASGDYFGFNSFNCEELPPSTKRGLLSRVATLFDPLQFLAPFTIRAKIILQQTWIQGLGWDEEFPPEFESDVKNWIAELPLVKRVRIPRCIQNPNPVHQSYHVFSDSSSTAYAAVIFVRSVYSDGSVTVRYVVGKSRVTPIKAVSIPRLELMAAVLGSRLPSRLSEVLGINPLSIWFWTDSMDVIHWIHGQSRTYKPFIAHRVSEIQEKTNPAQWRHVPGQQNPADVATRGTSMNFLLNENPWNLGPRFLYSEESGWPERPSHSRRVFSDEAEIELSKQKTATSSVSATTVSEPVIELLKFSSWTRLLRVTAWVLRFIHVLLKCGECNSKRSYVNSDEINSAEIHWLKLIQLQNFESTLQLLRKGQSIRESSLRSLCPFIDSDGLLRVGGRLQYSNLSFDARHPVILPSKSHLSKLIVRYFHEVGRHSKGTNSLLAEIRSRYWIIHGREAIKTFQRECIICKRLRTAKAAEQIMAPLPSLRSTTPVRAFARLGIDFAGPFITKVSRRVSAKRYLCLFTCATSRAVHLEMVYSLDTAGFLNEFSRMVARRGKPEEIVSDNATNFRGGNGELLALDQLQVLNKLSSDRIRWRFNPPLGSHHGGIFEALIKSAKKSLSAILGHAGVTDEELLTAIVEVEGLLNSRPLTYCSSDPKDDCVLTPNHFLYGQAGGQLAPRITDEIAFNPRNRWRFIQNLVQQLWRRWMSEYLSLLQQRGKWSSEQKEVTIDDIVILIDPSQPRGSWPLGRITKVWPGKDGHVRIVEVLSSGKTYRRPITRVAPLLTSEVEVTANK
ncbi:Uncharacterised protein r2_g452 [Pycnogonum litorale]